MSVVAEPCAAAFPDPESVVMYVGAYTRDEGWVNGTAKGINAFSFDPRKGILTHLCETDVGINPTFIRGTKVRKGQKQKQFLYAVNEISDPSQDVPGTTTGYVVAIEVAGKGQLKVLNRLETHGPGPTHISVSPSEGFVAASMYGGGGVILYPVAKNGSLAPSSDAHFYTEGSKVKGPQEAAHLHSTTWVPGSDIVFAADLGNDQIVQYKLDAKTKKFDNTTYPIVKRPPGSGPRHMDIHPSGKIAYVVDELSNTIGVFPLNAKDTSLPKSAIQNISTLPADFNGTSSSADIHVSADGKFVYSSNRGHNSIAIFKVKSQKDGTLEWVGSESTRGELPRSFLLYKEFLIVANQNTDNIEVFRRNAADGTLTHTGNSAKSNTPVCLYIPPN
uniref:6-phosphogluconolactonase n=1 Tax=Globisporangium ultimum (strain ATCC 200006 / CBS 805.95 / DAOM BR144) TaxID=431595 RepID=K3WI98_GLOUD